MEKIATLCQRACPSEYRTYFDMQIYTKNHCFRVWSSCKFSKEKKAGMNLVDVQSMKKLIDLQELFNNDRVITIPVDRSAPDYEERVMQSLISFPTYRPLTYDRTSYSDPVKQHQPRARCHQATTSRTDSQQGDFYTTNHSSNLYSILEKAASVDCGGTFKVRDVPVPSNSKYIRYNVDRKSKGRCTECKVEHDRDNCCASLLNANSEVAQIYSLSISCYRYTPRKKGHKYRKVYTLIKVGNNWNIK